MIDQIINNIVARQILDSRGNPTIEADVYLKNGTIGRASVPSGASTGDKEALELRDEASTWNGKGVNIAIDNINKLIKPAIIGKSVLDIKGIDTQMLQLDGTKNKSKLGANAMLAVSLANVQAGAISNQLPLFQYIASYYQKNYLKTPYKNQHIIPIPMMNILNGGSHADNNIRYSRIYDNADTI